jgi:hypothetical protein
VVKITMRPLYQKNHPRFEDKATMINLINPFFFVDKAIVVPYLFDRLLRIQVVVVVVVVVVVDEEVDKTTTNRLLHKDPPLDEDKGTMTYLFDHPLRLQVVFDDKGEKMTMSLLCPINHRIFEDKAIVLNQFDPLFNSQVVSSFDDEVEKTTTSRLYHRNHHIFKDKLIAVTNQFDPLSRDQIIIEDEVEKMMTKLLFHKSPKASNLYRLKSPKNRTWSYPWLQSARDSACQAD